MQEHIVDPRLPVKPGDKKKMIHEDSWLEKINLAKRMNPNAKKICSNCFTPIFDDGGCPNCGN